MTRRKIALAAFLYLAVSGAVHADMFKPSHSCSKPHKPYKFTSDWEISQFKNDVQRYKSCINDFVEEQAEAAQRHREAAEDAIDDWNSFVRYELS